MFVATTTHRIQSFVLIFVVIIGGYGGYGGNSSRDRDRGNNDNGASRRERSPIRDILCTKPDTIPTKKGKTGTPVTLTTNYFRLLKKPDWQLYQYRVDISPPTENNLFRKRLIADQKKHLGGYLFDGTMLFLSIKLRDDVTQFMTRDRNDDSPIQITVKFVGLLSMTSAASIQILNLILRRSMSALDLKLVGRNFFDAVAKVFNIVLCKDLTETTN